MTDEQRRKRVAELLLAELKAGKRGLYYISCASERGFLFACHVEAFGPTDANRLMHTLGFCEYGCGAETLTFPVPDGIAPKIPESLKWRRLTRQEALSIDDIVK